MATLRFDTRWEINHPMQHGSKGGVWPLRGAWKSSTYSLGNKNTNSWIKSLKFYTERNVQEHFDLDFPAFATKRYQMGFHGLMHMYIFGSVWHENLAAWKFTCRWHWEDESGIFQRPLPLLFQATIHEHCLHGRLHRGHTQADHTLCAKACMTHTQTHTHTIGAGNLAL